MNNLIKIFGLAGFLVSSYLFYDVFFTAYFNNYNVLITINEYGEAHIEMILLLLFIPFMILLVTHSLEETTKVDTLLNRNPKCIDKGEKKMEEEELICSACNETIKKGNPYICLSLSKEKEVEGTKGKTEAEVLDAISLATYHLKCSPIEARK